MKKIIIGLIAAMMALSLCACGSAGSSSDTNQKKEAEITFFEENDIVPTPIGITKFTQIASNSSTHNGEVTKISYTYNVDDGDLAAELETYKTVLAEQGFTVADNGGNMSIKKDDVEVATITVDTDSITIDLNPKAIVEDQTGIDFVDVNFGETIELDFATLTIGEIQTGDIRVGSGVTYVVSADAEGNTLYWLPVDVKNLNGEEFKITGNYNYCKFIFDNKYTYTGRFVNVEGGNAKAISPLETRTVYMHAEIPNEVIDSYQTVEIQFAFNEDFSEDGFTNQELSEYKYKYHLIASK